MLIIRGLKEFVRIDIGQRPLSLLRQGMAFVKNWMQQNCRMSMSMDEATGQVNMRSALSDFTKFISQRVPSDAGNVQLA